MKKGYIQERLKNFGFEIVREHEETFKDETLPSYDVFLGFNGEEDKWHIYIWICLLRKVLYINDYPCDFCALYDEKTKTITLDITMETYDKEIGTSLYVKAVISETDFWNNARMEIAKKAFPSEYYQIEEIGYISVIVSEIGYYGRNEKLKCIYREAILNEIDTDDLDKEYLSLALADADYENYDEFAQEYDPVKIEGKESLEIIESNIVGAMYRSEIDDEDDDLYELDYEIDEAIEKNSDFVTLALRMFEKLALAREMYMNKNEDKWI